MVDLQDRLPTEDLNALHPDLSPALGERCARPALPHQAGENHGRRLSGRRHRHHLPPAGGQVCRALQAAVRRRKPPRRIEHARRRLHGQGGARRPYPHGGHQYRAGDRASSHQARLRCAKGHPARRPGGGRAQCRGGEYRRSRPHCRRASRAPEGEAWRIPLRFGRRRQHAAHRRRAVHASHRDEAHPHSLQGQQPGAYRPPGWAGRDDARHELLRDGPDQGGEAACAGGHNAQAGRRAPQRPHARRIGHPGRRDEHLVWPFRDRRHAAPDRRAAERRAAAGAEAARRAGEARRSRRRARRAQRSAIHRDEHCGVRALRQVDPRSRDQDRWLASSRCAMSWPGTRRDSKAGFSFVNVSDGSSFHPVQVVAPSTLPNYADEVLRLTAGCAVEATGTIVPSPAKGQPFEMQASAIHVVGWVENHDSYPIQPKPHSLEFLREVAHLRPRTNVIAAATRVRHSVAQAIHRFFDENGFFWVNTPIITASDAEDAGALFRVSTLDLANLPRTPQGGVDFDKDFFSRETFLTVSGQLNVEAYCLALTKVYTFGPTFRAENSNTSRHLAEFWMIEPEIAFADLSDNATLAEHLLKFTFETLLKERQEDLAFFDERIEKGLIAKLEGIVGSEFVRMDYSEAVAVLERAKEKFEFPVKWGMDLQSEHERYLTEKHAKKPVVVMNYPKDIKAFYMRVNDGGKTVAAMDVLAPGIGEIIGGSQREERLDVLDARMTERGIDKEHYGWYRDLRRYGTVPHAGFGLGFERTLAYITGLANVRDAIPFPRTPGNARY